MIFPYSGSQNGKKKVLSSWTCFHHKTFAEESNRSALDKIHRRETISPNRKLPKCYCLQYHVIQVWLLNWPVTKWLHNRLALYYHNCQWVQASGLALSFFGNHTTPWNHAVVYIQIQWNMFFVNNKYIFHFSGSCKVFKLVDSKNSEKVQCVHFTCVSVIQFQSIFIFLSLNVWSRIPFFYKCIIFHFCLFNW